jgi:hypothetical protein
MATTDRKRAILAGAVLIGAVATLVVVLASTGIGNNASRLAAVLAFVGVLATASVNYQPSRRLGQESVQAEQRLRQEHEDEKERLKLDAAMRAGSLFSAADADHAHPAAPASGLLALTKLDQADLAVALLVDLWSGGNKKISDETAILVIDARSGPTSRTPSWSPRSYSAGTPRGWTPASRCTGRGRWTAAGWRGRSA